ncbi:hypothetical protein XENTR_v10000364 [Xenopus tropicalis]|nr:hypothetical protein XENTR_v10000364 [Xenopus tropicalis]
MRNMAPVSNFIKDNSATRADLVQWWAVIGFRQLSYQRSCCCLKSDVSTFSFPFEPSVFLPLLAKHGSAQQEK